MKKIFILTIIIFGAAVFSNVVAQVVPPGSSDKNLDDRNIKDRSIELDKIKRDADRDNRSSLSSDPATKLKFTEIKEDFEKIQMLQNGIVEAYTKSKQINYSKISANAGDISKSGMRLKGNLFAAVVEDKKASKKSKKKDSVQTTSTEDKTEKPLPTDVKSLIVELDNTIVAFTGSPMFTNPKVVSAADNIKAQADLARLIKLSDTLSLEADKTSKGGK